MPDRPLLAIQQERSRCIHAQRATGSRQVCAQGTGRRWAAGHRQRCTSVYFRGKCSRSLHMRSRFLCEDSRLLKHLDFSYACSARSQLHYTHAGSTSVHSFQALSANDIARWKTAYAACCDVVPCVHHFYSSLCLDFRCKSFSLEKLSALVCVAQNYRQRVRYRKRRTSWERA